MQLYVNYYDETQRTAGYGPTLGLILCVEKNDLTVRYTLGKENRRIFASRYKLHLPSEEELAEKMRRELAGSGAAGRADPSRAGPFAIPSDAIAGVHRMAPQGAAPRRRDRVGLGRGITPAISRDRDPRDRPGGRRAAAGGRRPGRVRAGRAPAAVDRRRRPVPILLSEARSATAEPVPSLPWVRRRNRRSNVDFGPSSARGPTCSCGDCGCAASSKGSCSCARSRAARCGDTWRGDSAPADRLRKWPRMTLVELLAQIARREATRSEATLQADIRQLVLTSPLSLSAENVVTADLETPVGVRRRIDIEVGSTPYRGQEGPPSGNVQSDANEQLADTFPPGRKRPAADTSASSPTVPTGARPLTGGEEAGPQREVSGYQLSPSRPVPEPFLSWLEGVLATAREIPATPREIGSGWARDSAFALDRESCSSSSPGTANSPPSG